MADFIDTHAHLDLAPLKGNEEEVLSRAGKADVVQVISVGIDLSSSRAAVAYANRFPGVFATVGVHPHDAKGVGPTELDELRSLAVREGVVAWGEIGLDYAKEYSPASVQRKVFDEQLTIARELELPVVIHDREAHDHCLEILSGYAGSGGVAGVVHCFSGGVDFAAKVLDLGLFISVTGVITFKKAEQLREVVSFVPLDRIFIETDSPFLSPVPFRGKPNEPARVALVAQKIAEIKGCSLEEVAECTTEAARRFFKLPTP